MDSLKKELEKRVAIYVGNAKDTYASAKEAKAVLKNLNLSRAVYVIALNPLWAHDGRKPICVEQRGSLEHVMREAERKFRSLNKKHMIGADYMAHIRLGNQYFEIPTEYWKHFCKLNTR